MSGAAETPIETQESSETLKNPTHRLVSHIAHGEFDVNTQPSTDKLTKVSEKSLTALRNQNMARRQHDADTFARKARQENGNLDEAEIKHKQFGIWAMYAVAELRHDLGIEGRGNRTALILRDKLHLQLTGNGAQDRNVIKQFYDADQQKGGSFYEEFCGTNMNDALAQALTIDEMMHLKTFLIKWMVGTDTAFNALLVLRATQDRIKQNNPITPQPTPVTGIEKKVLDFYAQGWKMEEDKTRQQNSTQPSSQPNPPSEPARPRAGQIAQAPFASATLAAEQPDSTNHPTRTAPAPVAPEHAEAVQETEQEARPAPDEEHLPKLQSEIKEELIPLMNYINEGLQLLQKGTQEDNNKLLKDAIDHFSGGDIAKQFKIQSIPGSGETHPVDHILTEGELEAAIYDIAVHARPGEMPPLPFSPMLVIGKFSSLDLKAFLDRSNEDAGIMTLNPNLFHPDLKRKLYIEFVRIVAEEWIHEMQEMNRGPIYVNSEQYDNETDIAAYFFVRGLNLNGDFDFMFRYPGRMEWYKDMRQQYPSLPEITSDFLERTPTTETNQLHNKKLNKQKHGL